jgi:hypothetical protein
MNALIEVMPTLPGCYIMSLELYENGSVMCGENAESLLLAVMTSHYGVVTATACH